jgi:hypothetical protein
MKLIVILLSAFVLFGIVSASTVTLTGSCYGQLVNQTNNYIIFNLTNSGNGSATNFVLEPILQGASTQNKSITIPVVAPSGSYSEKIYLSNFTLPGSYVERFVASYSQGSSTFITLFPCLVDINQQAQSLLGITNIGKASGSIYANISNIADYPINAQVVAYAPPAFTVKSPSQNVTIKQYSLTNVSFAYTAPAYTNAEFPITVAVSYVLDNVHYAALSVTTISFGGGTSTGGLGGNTVLIGIGIVIAIMLILIVISIVKKPKHPQHTIEETTEKEKTS